MKRYLIPVVPLVAALFALLSLQGAAAQVPGLTVSVPPGPAGQINATVNGQSCGTVNVSATASTTLTIPAACATPGATISFTGPGGVALGNSLTIPATGAGSLSLPNLDLAQPVTITVPAGPSGTVTAHVNGQACGSANVVPTSTSTISLPGTCATPGATISFTGAGGTQLGSTLTIPASGGGSLTLPNLNSASPVTISLPAGPSGTVNAFVNGQSCGSATISPTAPTTLTLPASCATGGGTITFTGSGGAALTSNLTVPASGGGNLSLGNLNTGSTITFPAGSGTVNVMVNGQSCGSVSLSSGSSTVFTLPATCVMPNGNVTFTVSGGGTLTSEFKLPASGTATFTVPNLNPSVTVVVPPGPIGIVTAKVNGQSCGSVTVSPTTTTTIELSGACSIPGATISFVGPNNAALSGTINIPTAGGNLSLPNLNAATPVNIVIPAGKGSLDVVINGKICATVELSAGSTSTVALPATCMMPGATISFFGTGGDFPGTREELFATLTMPSSGGGTLVLSSLASPTNTAVPGPAATGNGGYLADDGGFNTLALALALVTLLAAGAGTTLVLRARR